MVAAAEDSGRLDPLGGHPAGVDGRGARTLGKRIAAGQLVHPLAPLVDVHVLRQRRRVAEHLDDHRELGAGHRGGMYPRPHRLATSVASGVASTRRPGENPAQGDPAMIEWSEQHLMIRDMVRRFVEAEIKPNLEELEHGDMPPYDILRKMMRTFGMDEMARMRFQNQMEREKAAAAAGKKLERKAQQPDPDGGATCDHPDHRAVPLLPGHGDGDGRQHRPHRRRRSCRKGTIAQKERWALPLLTLEKIGAWAITEPGSGSDAFGCDEGDRAPRRRRLRAQRQQDVHHQRPVRRHHRLHLQARRRRDRARRTARC